MSKTRVTKIPSKILTVTNTTVTNKSILDRLRMTGKGFSFFQLGDEHRVEILSHFCNQDKNRDKN